MALCMCACMYHLRIFRVGLCHGLPCYTLAAFRPSFCGWPGGAVGFCVSQSWLSEWVPQVQFSVVQKIYKQ